VFQEGVHKTASFSMSTAGLALAGDGRWGRQLLFAVAASMRRNYGRRLMRCRGSQTVTDQNPQRALRIPGEIRAVISPSGAAEGKARSGDRRERKIRRNHPDPQPPHQEQPVLIGEPGVGKNRRSWRACPTHRQTVMVPRPCRTRQLIFRSTWRPDCRREIRGESRQRLKAVLKGGDLQAKARSCCSSIEIHTVVVLVGGGAPPPRGLDGTPATCSSDAWPR